ncbi:MAG: uncharacterized protein H6Q90_124 [Deltaproteobacteria bacterium]|nr:uncharacterized protein [Deltaproteobacteria bacterium]
MAQSPDWITSNVRVSHIERERPAVARACDLLEISRMQPAFDQPPPALPSSFDQAPRAEPISKHPVRRRTTACYLGLVAIGAGTGMAVALGARRSGVVAGGLAALALGGLRWQLARWFTSTPAYEVERTIGGLELRRYPLRIEARAAVDVQDFEAVLDRGFGRLACYSFGANSGHEDLEMTTPVVTTMHDGVYAVAFGMPPGRSLRSLPRPDDPRIELAEVAPRRVAAVRFRGRFTRDNVQRHERDLLSQLVDAGLSARGSVAFAAYDSPFTIPFLRRNELWIEVV